MSFVEKIDLENILNISKSKPYLAISERKAPKWSNDFLKNIINKPFNIHEKIYKKSCVNDIKNIYPSAPIIPHCK